MRLLYLLLLTFSLSLSAQSPELVIPGGHGYQIYAAEVSPDGKYLASASSNQVKIWDYPSGRLLKTITITTESSFTNTIYHLAFSNDSRYLAAPNGYQFNLIDLARLSVVDQKSVNGEGRKSLQIQDVVAHPNRPEFYFALRFNDKEHLMLYKIPSRELFLNAEWERFHSNQTNYEYLSWDPTGRVVLAANMYGYGGAAINTIDGTATAYKGAVTYLPNGNILSAIRFTSSIKFSVSTPAGALVWEKSIREERYGSRPYLYNQLAIDAKAQRFYYGAGDENMIAGSYLTGADLRSQPKPGGATNSVLTAAPNGSLIVTNNGDNWIAETNGSSGLVFRKFGAATLATTNLATDPASRHVAVAAQSGLVQIFDLTSRGPGSLFKTQLGHRAFVRLAPGGQFVGTYFRNQPVHWGSAATGHTIRIDPVFPGVRDVALDRSGNLAVVGNGGMAFYAAGSASPAWTLPWGTYDAAEAYDYPVVFSPDGATVVATEKTEDGYITRAVDTRNGQVRWTYEGWFGDYAFTPDGKTLIGGSGVAEIVRINARTGKESGRINRTDGKFFKPVFDAATGRMTGKESTYSVANEELHVVDTESGKITAKLIGHLSSIKAKGFLRGDLLLSAGFDNTTRLWNTRSGQELCKLFFFENGVDWVVLSGDGRFDATPGALSQLYYRVGSKLVDLEQFYESFYTPGLLGMLLEGNVPPAPAVNIDDVKPPPTVALDFQQGTRNLIVEDDDEAQRLEARSQDAVLVVRAAAPGSTVAEVRLFQNGKLLGGTRGLGVEDDTNEETLRKYQVRLLPGENTFRAIALNAERTESAPALLYVDYLAPASAPNTPQSDGITLHLLTVGINEYKNARYNLNYAEADAAGIETAIQTGLKGIVNNTQVHTIRNDGAKRAEILAAIRTVTERAYADDVFVFYYAGHGVMSEGATKDFFIVPHDVTQLYGNDDGLAAKGISASELKELAAAIPAQKQLYILDACQSAGAVQSIALRGAAEEKAIAQLARSTGTHWLTASGSEQFATEFDELGHGAFTYVLLQALAGEAAGDDGHVTVNELKAYLDRVVPEVTERYQGQAQYPASYGYGQDFPVWVRR